MQTEPVFSTALVSALVTAVLGALVAFGVPVTQDQQNAILGLTGAVCAIIVGSGLFARNFTYSRASVEKLTGAKDPVVPAVTR